jgi:hypothetical protein
MCVLSGWKDFTIVSPFHSDFVYMGHGDLPANYSPVNFDDPSDEFPKFSDATVLKVRIQDGDCLFLPANWWHRVTSAPVETIAVSFWYEPHDRVISLIQDFIQNF